VVKVFGTYSDVMIGTAEDGVGLAVADRLAPDVGVGRVLLDLGEHGEASRWNIHTPLFQYCVLSEYLAPIRPSKVIVVLVLPVE
jgi:hypothetical protein